MGLLGGISGSSWELPWEFLGASWAAKRPRCPQETPRPPQDLPKTTMEGPPGPWSVWQKRDLSFCIYVLIVLLQFYQETCVQLLYAVYVVVCVLGTLVMHNVWVCKKMVLLSLLFYFWVNTECFGGLHNDSWSLHGVCCCMKTLCKLQRLFLCTLGVVCTGGH